MQIAGFVVGK